MSRKITPTRLSDFDTTNMVVGKMEDHASKSRFCNLRYKVNNKKVKPVFQTGRLPILGGVKRWEQKDKDDNVIGHSYTISVTLRDYEGEPMIDGKENTEFKWDEAYTENKNQRDLYKWGKKFNTFLKDKVKKNLIPWFRMKKKDAANTTVDTKYYKPVDGTDKNEKTDDDGNVTAIYPSLFSFKVPFYNVNKKKDGEKKMRFGFDLFDKNKKPITDITEDNIQELIPDGSEVKLLFSVGRFWKQARVTAPLQVESMIVYPPEGGGCAFMVDSDDDEDSDAEDSDNDDDNNNDSDAGADGADDAEGSDGGEEEKTADDDAGDEDEDDSDEDSD